MGMINSRQSQAKTCFLGIVGKESNLMSRQVDLDMAGLRIKKNEIMKIIPVPSNQISHKPASLHHRPPH